jgi:tetratricopeptide (TPR) repeat protein
MRKLTPIHWMIILISLVLLIGLVYTFPPVQRRLSWRVDFAMAYLRGIIHPVGRLPTPMPTFMQDPALEPTETPSPTVSATATALAPLPTATPMPSPTPIPASMELPAPAWEKQDINNCGPASLAMYLRYYGWKGDQFEIANLLKPQRDDRNVNVDELAYYVRTHAGWLNVMFRVGGDEQLLKQLLAAGIPVIIEESFYFDDPFWPNDDLWAAHYNLITGYDDAAQTFTAQDSFHGPNQKVPYTTLADYWHVFNHVYLLVYPPEKEDIVKSILGKNWDEAANRRLALDGSLAETRSNPNDAFAWFNTGNNLVYFERYDEAAAAFDKARDLGLPQRMLRYQFSPFFAYFHTGRIQDLLDLTNYALKITPNAEEALLWHGWALYRKGDTQGALADFQNALVQNPNYLDAQYAVNFVQQNP